MNYPIAKNQFVFYHFLKKNGNYMINSTLLKTNSPAPQNCPTDAIDPVLEKKVDELFQKSIRAFALVKETVSMQEFYAIGEIAKIFKDSLLEVRDPNHKDDKTISLQYPSGTGLVNTIFDIFKEMDAFFLMSQAHLQANPQYNKWVQSNYIKDNLYNLVVTTVGFNVGNRIRMESQRADANAASPFSTPQKPMESLPANEQLSSTTEKQENWLQFFTQIARQNLEEFSSALKTSFLPITDSDVLFIETMAQQVSRFDFQAMKCDFEVWQEDHKKPLGPIAEEALKLTLNINKLYREKLNLAGRRVFSQQNVCEELQTDFLDEIVKLSKQKLADEVAKQKLTDEVAKQRTKNQKSKKITKP